MMRAVPWSLKNDPRCGAGRARPRRRRHNDAASSRPTATRRWFDISPQGPLALISTAITRRRIIDKSIVGAEQAISLDDAIRAVTIHAAQQLGQGGRLGSLEKGKEADFTILETDSYNVSPDAIADIKVSETWVAGERKFAA